MFLSKLTQEKKELFLQLSFHAAMSNNIMAEEQKSVINEYCLEMGLSNVNMEVTMELEEVLEKIKNICEEQEIRIVAFEILGLLFSDKTYDELEKDFVNKLKIKFQLSDELIETMLTLLSDFDAVFTKICDTVL